VIGICGTPLTVPKHMPLHGPPMLRRHQRLVDVARSFEAIAAEMARSFESVKALVWLSVNDPGEAT
jgi:beta-glucosidase-like glycosyl hydrolase